MLIRTIAPLLEKPSAIILGEPEKIILQNGVPVYVINAGEQDVTKIEIFFKAGADAHENFLIPGATNELLDEGTRHHTAAQIAGEFEFYGSFLQTECTADWAVAGLFTINKFLENVFPLLHEIISEPVFPEKELETFKVQNKQRLQVNNNKVDYVARKIFNQKLFGQNTAYGFYQDEKDYEKIDRNSLQEFHRKNYMDRIFAIIVSGRVSDKAVELIREFFGKSKNVSNIISPTNHSIHEPEKYFEKKKDALQSGIRIGRKLFNKTHADYKALNILNVVLGGYFGSRLMSNIREDKGYTYGIGSALVSLQHSGYFVISTEAGVEVCKAAVKEIYYEIERLRNEPVPGEELDLVRNYLIGSFQRSIDGPFALSERLRSVLTYGLGYEYFYDYLHLIKTISSEQLLILTEKYLDPAQLTEVIIG